jgi:hypothetical protein
MRAARLALLCCLLGGSAIAETPTTAPPTPVAGLTVTPATKAPKVAATFPTAGQAITAGILVVTVTFDERMGGGYDYAPGAGGEMPDCLKTPRLLADGKTFALLCNTLPGKSYSVTLNSGGSGGFANTSEARAEPVTLTFSTTTGGEPVRSLEEAMKAASLTGVDMPVQDAPGLLGKAGG